MNEPQVEIRNLGDDLSPVWRLLVDGVVVAGHYPRHELVPLFEELAGDPVKALALRDAVVEIATERARCG